MISTDYTRDLFISDSDARIVLCVIDGLGGIPHPDTGKTELETASLPNLDALASAGDCGLISPLGPGLTPGSGPAHMALFGYDPWTTTIGRGALSGLGLGLDFRPGDVAARMNFCTVDGDGLVTDRRAGRIPTEKGAELCEILKAISVPGVELSIAVEMEYRAVVVFRGEGLADGVADSDPQVTGLAPLPLRAASPESDHMVEVAEQYLSQAAELLRDEQPANMVLMRGFGRYPQLPQMQDVYGLNPCGIAGYPMYRGVARAVGMRAVDTDWHLDAELEVLRREWDSHDFFYFHVKKTDSAGEDGDFDHKVELLEEADACVGSIRDLGPEVLVVTGDHSTPAIMASHSWHPVPLVISSEYTISSPGVGSFSERSCANGSLGVLPSSAMMTLALAHARRLSKFGA